VKETTTLYHERLAFQPVLPLALRELTQLKAVPLEEASTTISDAELQKLFPHTWKQGIVTFLAQPEVVHRPQRVGVVLSGGQAAGGHNVITGLYDALVKLHPDSRLFGFLGGATGLIDNEAIEITQDLLTEYRNQGGFDIIGSGRAKVETEEQMQAAEKTVKDLRLTGLLIIGGDDSNTNAAVLAEYFLASGCDVNVVGVPKTIDGDLKNEHIEASFGFDTACKIFSELIGNICRDTFSAKKYYHFIKLMGRSASHIALECALQTHANMTLISEEIADKGMTLQQITTEICDMICRRAEMGKNFGVLLIPEGVIEFIPEFKDLITELNDLLAKGGEDLKALEAMSSAQDKVRFVSRQLYEDAKNCFVSIPESIQHEMLLDRDPHGNVQVSKIETEKLLLEAVRKELHRRKVLGEYVGKFSYQTHFFGYEGRSAFPSNFDAQYCYALGQVAALLVDSNMTGYMTCVGNLVNDVEQWNIKGIPLSSMMVMEKRHGKPTPVIKKTLVDPKGKAFQLFENHREQWKLEDDYRYPGPVQFFGPREISNNTTLSLRLERQ